MTLSVEWKIEDLHRTNDRGQRLVRVHETYSGDDGPENQIFEMPGVTARTFIQGRRHIVQTQLSARGYDRKEPSIDWSFLEKGTKQ